MDYAKKLSLIHYSALAPGTDGEFIEIPEVSVDLQLSAHEIECRQGTVLGM